MLKKIHDYFFSSYVFLFASIYMLPNLGEWNHVFINVGFLFPWDSLCTVWMWHRLMTFINSHEGIECWCYCWGKVSPLKSKEQAVISAWISNYTHHKVWDEITYPFPNFNSCTVEVWEWISNIISHIAGHVITYPMLWLKLIHVGKRGPSHCLMIQHIL